MPRKYSKFSLKNRCKFCRDQINFVDYKDISLLSRMCSAQGKILSRRKTGNCARHQRMATQAVKRARYMALLPFVATGIV